jgi:hypothetical protein
MIPADEKNYKDVVIPKIWEAIVVEEEGREVIEHVLVNKKISDYIRSLEEQLLTTKKLLADKIGKTKAPDLGLFPPTGHL